MLDPTPSLVPLMEDAGTNSPVWMKWFQQLGEAAVGYGGIRSTQDHILGTVDGTWTVLKADDGTVVSPILVGQSPFAESIFVEAPGVWQLFITVTLSFDELNAGRAMEITLYNKTADVYGTGTTMGVGRNTEYLNYSASLILETDSTLNEIQVVVGNADTFTNVTQLNYRLDAVLLDFL